MLHYILQTIAFQLFFLIIYDVFLKRDTFFNWNRAYLLITTLLSIILPFVKIEQFKDVVPRQFIIMLPEVILGNLTQTESNFILENGIQQTSGFVITWELFFILGATIAFILFIYKLIKIGVLIYKNPKHWKGNILIIKLLNSSAAFSFLHYIFLGERIKVLEKESIFKHELIHVQEKHTLDLLFFEVLRILFWFNPLIYMYQNRMSTLHEYIADAKAVKTQDETKYYENLLAQVFETKSVSFINTFFKQSLIKKRIVMLTKSKSKQVNLIKYALLIPMVFGMLMYTSSNAQEKVSKEEVAQGLTDEQLKDKFYKELIKLEESGADFFTIADAFMPSKDEYVSSRESFYKFVIYIKRIGERTITRKRKDGTLTQEDIDRNKEMLKKRKTYEEYLKWKKTDKSKEIWENQTSNGTLKLVVNKLGSYTHEEQKDYDGKIKLLLNDDFYTKLIISDGKVSKEIHDPNKSKRDEFEVQEVPFALIDNVPIYQGCENLSTNQERKKCMADKINKHVVENFNVRLGKELGLKRRQRVNVIFKIDKDGNVKGIRSRAPHPDLETEAIRVISLLPKMIPGTHKGKNVIVPYSLPIIFQVGE